MLLRSSRAHTSIVQAGHPSSEAALNRRDAAPSEHLRSPVFVKVGDTAQLTDNRRQDKEDRKRPELD
jgi:hypothetical protein